MLHAEGTGLGCLTGLAPLEVLCIKATSSHLSIFTNLSWLGMDRRGLTGAAARATSPSVLDADGNGSGRVGHGAQDLRRF
jgi:hypothetical protein